MRSGGAGQTEHTQDTMKQMQTEVSHSREAFVAVGAP